MKEPDDTKKDSEESIPIIAKKISKAEAIELSKKVGPRIKSCRKYLRLAQQEVAAELEISHSYLSEIESGSAKANPAILIQLMTLYNINIEYLFTGEGPMIIEEPESEPRSEFSLDNSCVESVDKLNWLIKNSIFAQQSILAFATRFVIENDALLRKTMEPPKG